MIRRILAWWLFVLAVSPFTAPFSTCDLATLFSHAAAITLNTSVVQAAAPQKVATDADEVVLVTSSFTRTGEPAKLLAIARFGPQPLTTSNNLTFAATLWVHIPMRLPEEQPIAPPILRL
jgi:hypothetical protein